MFARAAGLLLLHGRTERVLCVREPRRSPCTGVTPGINGAIDGSPPPPRPRSLVLLYCTTATLHEISSSTTPPLSLPPPFHPLLRSRISRRSFFRPAAASAGGTGLGAQRWGSEEIGAGLGNWRGGNRASRRNL